MKCFITEKKYIITFLFLFVILFSVNAAFIYEDSVGSKVLVAAVLKRTASGFIARANLDEFRECNFETGSSVDVYFENNLVLRGLIFGKNIISTEGSVLVTFTDAGLIKDFGKVALFTQSGSEGLTGFYELRKNINENAVRSNNPHKDNEMKADKSGFKFGLALEHSVLIVEVMEDYTGGSTWGAGGKLSACYIFKNGFKVGTDFSFNVYEFSDWGYMSLYKTVDLMLTGGYEFYPIGDFFIDLDLGAGINYRNYEKQRGFFPVVSGYAGFGYDFSDFVSVTVGAELRLAVQRLITKGIYRESDLSYCVPILGLRVGL